MHTDAYTEVSNNREYISARNVQSQVRNAQNAVSNAGQRVYHENITRSEEGRRYPHVGNKRYGP